ncbi:MAG: hypothetical protein CM15mP22_0550 [Gammaproteobacteria bacterium]|nr:MAG: hypothetical protein CM15mP22_0550 [Gammaproteobacteria bacterium]
MKIKIFLKLSQTYRSYLFKWVSNFFNNNFFFLDSYCPPQPKLLALLQKFFPVYFILNKILRKGAQ